MREATALNVIDMIGVGPFITIPLIISAMHGPQAMLGWIVGALLAMCDGLVWAELGASMPKAGGSYEYLKQSYGAQKLGRMMSFLFVWQLVFSAPLSIASGCVGLARYAVYVWPSLGHVLINRTFSLFGVFPFQLLITFGTFVAMAVCLLALFLLVPANRGGRQHGALSFGRRARGDSPGHVRWTHALQGIAGV